MPLLLFGVDRPRRGGGVTLVLGIDLSTRRLDGAIVPLAEDAPQGVTLRRVSLSRHADGCQLYREVRQAVAQLVCDAEGREVSYVVVEAPRGPYAVRQLNG